MHRKTFNSRTRRPASWSRFSIKSNRLPPFRHSGESRNPGATGRAACRLPLDPSPDLIRGSRRDDGREGVANAAIALLPLPSPSVHLISPTFLFRRGDGKRWCALRPVILAAVPSDTLLAQAPIRAGAVAADSGSVDAEIAEEPVVEAGEQTPIGETLIPGDEVSGPTGQPARGKEPGLGGLFRGAHAGRLNRPGGSLRCRRIVFCGDCPEAGSGSV